MADIELVIKLPEKVINRILEYKEMPYTDLVIEAIYHGVQLPKGHSRLIDADELKKYYPHNTDWEYPVNTNEYVNETIDNAPTIIEADNGE